MATKLGEVAGIPVIKKDERGYILENGTIIADTYAEMFHNNEIEHSVLGQNPLFF
jgi:hypothetical protein